MITILSISNITGNITDLIERAATCKYTQMGNAIEVSHTWCHQNTSFMCHSYSQLPFGCFCTNIMEIMKDAVFCVTVVCQKVYFA